MCRAPEWDGAGVQVYKATRGGVTTVAAKIMSSTVSDGSASTARTQVSIHWARLSLHGPSLYRQQLNLLCFVGAGAAGRLFAGGGHPEVLPRPQHRALHWGLP